LALRNIERGSPPLTLLGSNGAAGVGAVAPDAAAPDPGVAVPEGTTTALCGVVRVESAIALASATAPNRAKAHTISATGSRHPPAAALDVGK
jgi:hypothetical protein